MKLKNTLSVAVAIFAIGITSNTTFAAGGGAGTSHAPDVYAQGADRP